MLKKIQSAAEDKMKKTIDVLHQNLLKLRTGRAHPSLLDSVTVEYYGTPTPVNQVANITIEDARTLLISTWDKAMTPVVDKAIRASDLGLNPAVSGNVIRVMLPPLTEERRKDLVKQLKQEAEESKIVVRNIRRDANQETKQLLKKKEITEDDERKGEDIIQKLTDRYIGEIDKIVTHKEKELMQI